MRRVDWAILCKQLQLLDITSNGFFCCLGHMCVILVSKRECFCNLFCGNHYNCVYFLKGYGYCTAAIHGHVVVVPVHQYDVNNWVVSSLYTSCT